MQAYDHMIISCRACGFLFAEPLGDALGPHYDEEYVDDFIARDDKNGRLRRRRARLTAPVGIQELAAA
jgi:hypothetical protein